MNPPIDWLLEGEPWVVYRTRRDLLGEPERAAPVRAARQAMLASPLVAGLVADLTAWPGEVIASHKSAGQLFHKLTFAADLGLKASDPGLAPVVDHILSRAAPEGPFQLPTNIPTHYGGSGRDTWGWALCDAPLTLYALAKMGLAKKPALKKGAAYLAGLVRANGWPCAVSKELGSFRGPGRKDDPCPFATLAMLKALGEFDAWRDSPARRTGAETLLSLWAASRAQHPYMFYMGTDFRKLKAPLVWYDLLHVLDTLARCAWLRGDARLRDMAALLAGKADAQGRFTPESIWMVWKAEEFGQKKAPSRWLTLLAWRSLRAVEG